jgi:hypothetical protein
MMNDEKLFRDRLFNYEVSYPDNMWDRISDQLPKKKKRGGWWFFMLVAFILVGVFSGIMLPSTGSEADIENYGEVTPEAYTELTDQLYEEKPEVVVYTAEEESGELEQAETRPISPVLSSSRSIIKNAQQSEEKINPETGSYSQAQGLVKITLQDNTSSDKAPIDDVFASSNLNNEAVSNAANNEVVEPRTYLNKPGRILPLELLIKEEMPEFTPPECPTFSFGREPGIYFDLLYSHDVPNRTLTLKSQELSDYIDNRNNTESTLYSFSASFRISYISRSGFGLKTGFNYSQINEKFEYLDPDASLIRTIITIDTLLVGGVSTVVTDTSTIRIPGSLDITSYNRYRFFDIPVLATYEAPLNDKFYYSVNGGVLINMAFSQKGRFLDPAGMPVWFTSSEPDNYDAFNNAAGLSFFGSIGLHYSLNDHLDIILEPNFRLYAGSLTSEPYPLEQRWLTLGLSHGIRYKF